MNELLSDDVFIERFEAHELSSFTHRDHVRVAYVYALRGGTAAAVDGARRIRGLAEAAGDAGKYHDTITVAWAHVIAHLVACSAPGSFETFLDAHVRLLDRRLLSAHYSDGLLFSPTARAGFVEPDLAPLP